MFSKDVKLSNLKPLHDWILVKKDFKEMSAGGIMLTRAKDQHPTTGTVIRCGDEVTMVKAGDRIHFPYAAGTTMEHGGEKLSIIKEIDLNGIIYE